MDYPILLAFDSNYSKYSLVLIKNIIDKTHKKKSIIFYIVVDELTDFSFQLDYLKTNDIRFELNIIDSEEFANYMTSLHLSRGAYYLLKGLEIVSNYHDYCLYMDIDIYVKIPIETIFSELSNLHSLTVPSIDDDYFGSGLFLVNFLKNKEKFSMKNFNSIYLKYRDSIIWHDQDILNIAFKNDWKKISILWDFNSQYWKFGKKHYKKIGISIHDTKIIHFAATSKPWRFSTVLPYAREWRQNYYEIYSSKPWGRVSLKELIIKLIYLVIPNPSYILKYYVKLKTRFKNKK